MHARGAPRSSPMCMAVGEAADTFHRTRSHPDGQAIIRSISGAINDAGLLPADVGYINAHGTGTSENDKMEHFGIASVYGEAVNKVAVSSNKSMIGHSLTAAGAVGSCIHGYVPEGRCIATDHQL